MKRSGIDLRGELVCRPGATYHIQSAYHRGRAVAVKVFEGPHASEVSDFHVHYLDHLFKVFQDHKANLALSKKLLYVHSSLRPAYSDSSLYSDSTQPF